MKVLLIAAFVGAVFAAPRPSEIKFRNLYKDPLFPLKSQPSSGRIINGEVAEPHSIPYQVFLEIYGSTGAWYCGGSLIAENSVLSAGHCGYNAEMATVFLGAQTPLTPEDSQVLITSTNIVVHEGYNGTQISNDISLFNLIRKVELTDAIQLSTLPADDKEKYVGKIGRVSGWGITETGGGGSLSDVLRYTENPILDNEICGQTFGPIPDYQMCLSGEGGHSSCNGDSGGPLTVDGVLVGIVSYGRSGCLTGFPSFFTRVSSFLDWIAANSPA